MSHLPTWVYHPKEHSKIVHTQDDLDIHLEDGWQLTPASQSNEPVIEETPITTPVIVKGRKK